MSNRIDEKDLPQVTPSGTDEVRLLRAGKSVRAPASLLPVPLTVQSQLDAIQAALGNGLVPYQKASDLPSTDPGVGKRLALVWGDETDENNGTWAWSGSSWSKATDPATRLVPQVAIPITLTGSDPDALEGTTPNGLNPSAGQLVSFRKDSSANTSAVTIVLNGGSARQIVSQTGAALSAGQLLANGNYVCRVSPGGTLMLVSPVEATEAQALAGTNGINVMTARRVESVAAPIRTNARRSRYVVDGCVVRDWVKDANTRVVSLSQGRVWVENNGAAVAYSINPVIDAELTNRKAIVVDLDSAADGNGRLTPYVTPGNLASSGETGWQSGNKIVLYSVGNQQSGNDTLQIRGGGHYRHAVGRQPEMDDIIIQASGGLISIYTAGGINNHRFIEWRFGNASSTAPNENVIAGDVWRMIGVYDCSFSIDRVKTRIQQIIRTSEWETAIRENGKPDFVGGGSHGNQIKQTVKAFIDGVEVNPTSAINQRCRRFELFQTSKLYRYGELPGSGGEWDESQEIGTVHTHWLWDRGQLFLDNTLVMSQALTLDYTYLGILPVYREVAPVAGGDPVEIVTSGWRDSPSLGIEDLSTDSYVDTYTKSAIMRGWGAGGYMLEMEKLSGWDKPNRDCRFASAVDNKFYQNITGTGYAATGGEVIHARTRYAIQIP